MIEKWICLSTSLNRIANGLYMAPCYYFMREKKSEINCGIFFFGLIAVLE